MGYDLGLDDVGAIPQSVKQILGLHNVSLALLQPAEAVRALRRALDTALDEEVPSRLNAYLVQLAPILPMMRLPELFGFPRE